MGDLARREVRFALASICFHYRPPASGLFALRVLGDAIFSLATRLQFRGGDFRLHVARLSHLDTGGHDFLRHDTLSPSLGGLPHLHFGRGSLCGHQSLLRWQPLGLGKLLRQHGQSHRQLDRFSRFFRTLVGLRGSLARYAPNEALSAATRLRRLCTRGGAARDHQFLHRSHPDFGSFCFSFLLFLEDRETLLQHRRHSTARVKELSS